MPNDKFDDEELDAAGISHGKKRLEPGQGSNPQGKGNQARDKSAPVFPASSALPIGMAHQVELLLETRQHRLRRFLTRIGIFVLLPTFIVWFYTALIATPRYNCSFQITYQSYAPSSTLAGGLTQSDVGSSVVDSIDYGTLIYQYIRSISMAEKIDQQIKLRDHLSSDRIDHFSRLAKNASQATYLAYWLNLVSASEGFGGYLTVNAQGFDPKYTLLLAQTINADTDAMIDGLSTRARTAEVQSASDQLNIAATALKGSDDALTKFRNTHGDLDPSFAATQLATVVGTLESQLALLRAQLQQAQANMHPGASQIVQLQLQVDALVKQIAAERDRLADTGQSSYSDTVSQYNDLLSDQQFANTTYQSAQQGLVIARADAAAKQNYVVDFAPPVLPDHPTLPDPLIASFTTFLVFLALYGIFNLLFAAFRDQSGI
jgi:capsular polysaccharide transport system permease protein